MRSRALVLPSLFALACGAESPAPLGEPSAVLRWPSEGEAAYALLAGEPGAGEERLGALRPTENGWRLDADEPLAEIRPSIRREKNRHPMVNVCDRLSGGTRKDDDYPPMLIVVKVRTAHHRFVNRLQRVCLFLAFVAGPLEPACERNQASPLAVGLAPKLAVPLLDCAVDDDAGSPMRLCTPPHLLEAVACDRHDVLRRAYIEVALHFLDLLFVIVIDNEGVHDSLTGLSQPELGFSLVLAFDREASAHGRHGSHDKMRPLS
jgi:hypothetical protein